MTTHLPSEVVLKADHEGVMTVVVEVTGLRTDLELSLGGVEFTSTRETVLTILIII